MGIRVEFNPDLALRKSGTPNREKEECLPCIIEKGKIYNFLKEGQRLYWLDGELALLETKREQQLSRPLASIRILEATHFLKDDKPYTSGKYKIIEIFDRNDPEINFEWMKRR